MFVVAGVTGKVGSAVASELLSHGEKIKVLLRDTAKGADWARKGADVAVGELSDVAFVRGALEGAEGFFAMLPPSYGAAEFNATQRKLGDAIAAAVKQSKVPHVVLLSSIGADLPEGTGPIQHIHHLETELRGTPLLTTLRAGYFQENVHSALAPAKQQGIFPNMSGSADYAFPMIATRDIGQLAAHELMFPSAKSEVIDLVGPAYSIRQVAEKLGAALGKKLQIVEVPPAEQVKALQQGGMGKELAESMAEMNAAFASGKISPKGDRQKRGRTPLDAVIKHLV